ncbi:MAG: hypothetical protein WBA88_08240 [Pseudaminobacter sp.]
MTEKARSRVTLVAPLVVSSLVLGGCVSSPTYGTDKTSTEQLAGDLTGILSVAPKNRGQIDYKPRPELVKPKPGETLALPAPQESIVTAENSQWPESPEQRRARLRAEATENRDTPGWRPEIQGNVNAPSSAPTLPMGTSQHSVDSGVQRVSAKVDERKAFNQRLAEVRQGSDTQRKYLSEPPLTYRQPAGSAPVGDIGEDELKKERRLKSEARKKSGSSRWYDIMPW